MSEQELLILQSGQNRPKTPTLFDDELNLGFNAVSKHLKILSTETGETNNENFED